ncbi:hypothetical protein DB895_02640 [Flavobacterium psychrotolerans]|uniref:DUF5689 domain-containing protein n=1 Tax=Flavobacterium psychrotolerans TaxID=2169410 RepID=A0A2U1JPT8_9FLAO|nr:hypothetical protein DB895_02640 [Flavobacterium psychrotolerans]
MKNVLLVSAMISLFSSCVKEEYANPIVADCVNPGLIATKEVKDIYAIAKNPTGTPANSPTYTEDDIIEAYVISSDEGGNFFKSMYLQPLDGSKGFNFSINEGNVYAKNLQPGKKVFLKLKGLAFANPTSFGIGLIFGAPPTDKFAVDRLSELTYKQYIIPSCDVVSEDAIVKHLSLSEVKKDIYLNTLVEIDDVQFSDATAGGTYDTDRTDNSDSSTIINSGVKGSIELDVRVSRYANFAGYKVPRGHGKIRGVLTKYGTGYQIIMRTERDVKMESPRVSPPVDPALQFTGSLTESFESYSVGDKVFPKFINDQTVGNRYWALKQFPTGTGNKYIEMTSFGGGGVIAKSYFLVPVDFTAANTFTFKKEIRYNAGEVLKVFYVTSDNYAPNGPIDVTKFTDITSSFSLVYPASGSSDNSFSSAGTYSIPASLTGTGFFVFQYSGTPTVTTTIQLDDITIN